MIVDLDALLLMVSARPTDQRLPFFRHINKAKTSAGLPVVSAELYSGEIEKQSADV